MCGGVSVNPGSLADLFFDSPQPDVVFEESDAEVVVVNLKEGVYYFLSGPAAFVWMAVHSGLSGDGVVSALSSLDDIPDTLEDDVLSFIGRLIELGLLRSIESPGKSGESAVSVSEYFPNGYRAPELETYSDLQDILLLDPIHDVDETGWPSRKPE
jgi:hypothetical protein